MIPPTFFFFLKIVLATLVPLPFHINFRINSPWNSWLSFNGCNRTGEWQFLGLDHRSYVAWSWRTSSDVALRPVHPQAEIPGSLQLAGPQLELNSFSQGTVSKWTYSQWPDKLWAVSPGLWGHHKCTRHRNQELASGPCSCQEAFSKGLSFEALAVGAADQGVCRRHLPSLPCFQASQHLEVCAPLGAFTSTRRFPLQEEAKNH